MMFLCNKYTPIFETTTICGRKLECFWYCEPPNPPKSGQPPFLGLGFFAYRLIMNDSKLWLTTCF